VVPGLLAGRDLTGTVTAMDTLLTPVTLAQQIRRQNGHYLMVIKKKNQPTLYGAAELVSRELPVPVRPDESVTGQAQEKQRSRLETRQLTSTTALNDYLH